jgi:hypothetical protein
MILCGQMRTYDFESIVNSYHKYLSSYGNIDLYIFTWKNRGYSNRHGNTNTHEKQNDIIEEQDIISHYSQFKFFSIKKIQIDDFEVFYENLSVEMKNIYHTPFRNHGNITTSIPVSYKYQQASLCLSSSNDYSKYSNVILNRPDMEITCDLPIIDPLDDVIYFKSECNRCMDHCWFGTPTTITKQLYNIFDNYELNYSKITDHNENNRDNNEILIYQCVINNIKILTMDGNFVIQKFFTK